MNDVLQLITKSANEDHVKRLKGPEMLLPDLDFQSRRMKYVNFSSFLYWTYIYLYSNKDHFGV